MHVCGTQTHKDTHTCVHTHRVRPWHCMFTTVLVIHISQSYTPLISHLYNIQPKHVAKTITIMWICLLTCETVWLIYGLQNALFCQNIITSSKCCEKKLEIEINCSRVVFLTLQTVASLTLQTDICYWPIKLTCDLHIQAFQLTDFVKTAEESWVGKCKWNTVCQLSWFFFCFGIASF